MSDRSDMWNRFFRGSKYEDKWLKRDRPAQSVATESRLEEVSAWLARVAVGRRSTAMKRNPFDRLAVKRDVA